MRILFVTSYLPHPEAGGSTIRSYNLLKQLASHHEIVLCAYYGPYESDLNEKPLQKLGIRVHLVKLNTGYKQSINAKLKGLFTFAPYTLQSFKQPDMQRLIHRIVSTWLPDVIHCDLLRMAWVPEVAGWQIPSVLDQHNVEYQRFQSQTQIGQHNLKQWPILLWEYYRLKQYERAICKRHTYVTAVTDKDKEGLLTLTNFQARVVTLPVGVDTEYFKPFEPIAESPALIFAGTMFYFPNEDGIIYFCREIFPRVADQVPDVKLLIVGRHPTEDVLALANNEQITVTGSVPDVRPYFAKSSVCVIPVRSGGGIKQKVLEAMAMGMPIVTNSFSCIGIPIQSDRDVLIRDDPTSFAEAIVSLLRMPHLRSKLSTNASRFIRQNYSWQKSASLLEEVYLEAVERHGRSSKEHVTGDM